MAGIKERLIQFILRGKDELSPEAKKSADALAALREEGDKLRDTLDDANTARGLSAGLAAAERAAERASAVVERAEQTAAALRAELDQNPGSKGLTVALREAEKEAARARQQLDQLTGALAEQQQAAQDAGVDTGNLSAEETRLAAEVEQAKRALTEHNRGLSELERQQAAAARAAAEHTADVEANGESFASASKKVLAFVAAYITVDAAIGLVRSGLGLVRDGITAVFSEGSDGEQALGQLEAAIRSTGSAAGLTAEQLLEMADQLRDNSQLTTEQIVAAQTRLLSYTDVAGKEFPRAMQIIVDQQQRLGISVEQSAEIVGKALQSPAEAMTALSRQGFKLGEGQKQLLERLVATGKTAEAQSVIMDMLSEAYGGSAAAARLNTFSGLWKTITDQLGDFAGTVAASGSFDFIKGKLQEVGNYIKEMASDGRLDTLAEALSKAFIAGAEKVEEFTKKLLDVDFEKLTNNTADWLKDVGAKFDDMTVRVQLFIAPFRILFNGLTAGLSGFAAAFTATISDVLGLIGNVAEALPDSLGGEKLRTAVRDARGVMDGLTAGLTQQFEGDAADINAILEGMANSAGESAEEAVQRAADAVKDAEAEKVAAAKEAAAAIIAETDAVAAAAIEAAISGKTAIADMASALQLIDTAKSREELEGLRRALLKAFQDGSVSQTEYQQSTGVLNIKLKEMGGAASSAGNDVAGLAGELKTLKDVQAALATAKTDQDISAIQAALKKLYGLGIIDAKTYNAEVAKTSAKQKELKGALEQTTKAQQGKTEADKEALVTSAQLRQESGKRMVQERQAGDQAMQDRRKGAEEAKRDVADMEDFFGGALTRAREPLAEMSEAALDAFDKLQGLSTVDLSLDTSSVETTTASLTKATAALNEMQGAAGTVGLSGFGRFMTETAVRSQTVQVEFLKQKLALQELMDSYERGGTDLNQFVASASTARRSLNLLNDSDLRTLEGAIDSAKLRMKSLDESTRSTLQGLQMELLQLKGTEEEIEKARFDSRKREIQAQIANARQGGDGTAVSNLQEALRTLGQIETETANKRDLELRQKRFADSQKTQVPAAPAAPQQQAPGQVIRLETRGRAVDLTVQNDSQKTALLDILADAGLRSL